MPACLGLATLSLLVASGSVWASNSHDTSNVRISLKSSPPTGARQGPIAKSRKPPFCFIGTHSYYGGSCAACASQSLTVTDPCAVFWCIVVRMYLGLCLGIGTWNGDADWWPSFLHWHLDSTSHARVGGTRKRVMGLVAGMYHARTVHLRVHSLLEEPNYPFPPGRGWRLTVSA